MKFQLLFTLLLFSYISYSQSNKKITSLETVEILNDNTDEALYYFQNNWKKLREKAVKNYYIDSFQMLHTNYSEETPFSYNFSNYL